MNLLGQNVKEEIEIDQFTNLNLNDLVMPVKVRALHVALGRANYDETETKFLCTGFGQGFDIGYDGPQIRQDTSNNIPLRIGSKEELWQKIMKEVKLGRYAGPFERIPYKNYI